MECGMWKDEPAKTHIYSILQHNTVHAISTFLYCSLYSDLSVLRMFMFVFLVVLLNGMVWRDDGGGDQSDLSGAMQRWW